MSVSKILTFILPTKVWHKKNAAVLHFSECRVSMRDVPCRLSGLSQVAPMSARAVPGADSALTLAATAALLYIVVLHGALSVLHTGFELANTESH